MKPKIDPNKKYTSNGSPVEFLHRAPDGWRLPHPWRGIVQDIEMTWTDDGIFCESDGADFLVDLIEVREPLEVMVVVNCHGKPIGTSLLALEEWDETIPADAPHRLVKFREVIE